TMRRKTAAGAVAGMTIAALTLAACSGGGEGDEGGGDGATLTIVTNAIAGGKNEAEATWINEWVIPQFEQAMADEGQDVTVEFEAQGVDDEDYKTKIALDLQSGGGADIIGIDGI